MAEQDFDVIRPGEFYEDCAYHPCVCVGSSIEDDDLWGISLIDGTQPRSCSFKHCGVRKLTIEEVWEWKMHGPPELRDDPTFPDDKKWWRSNAG